MKRKLLLILLAVFGGTALAAGLAACDEVIVGSGEEHTHVYAESVIAPTCAESGYTLHKCECGEFYKDGYSEALGHDWGDWIEIKAATCTEKGEEKQVCKRDSSHISTREIDITEHTAGEWETVTEPSCTEDGEKVIKCTQCLKELQFEAIPATGHTPLWETDTEANCEEDGVRHSTCSVCNIYLTEELIPATGHSIVWETDEEATCEDAGSRHGECSVCQKKFEEEIAALGHSWLHTITSETHSSVCERCEKRVTDGAHIWDDNNCSFCGYDAGGTKNLEWTLDEYGNSYILCGIGKATDLEIVIPAKYNGLGVTAIGNNAFENCREITSVDIPDGITEIGDCAFYFCRCLKQVIIPDSVKVLGRRAFDSCLELTSVKMSNAVEIIDGGTFSGCRKLTEFVMPDSVTLIGGSAFAGCSALSSVRISENLEFISIFAFFDCSELTSVTLPESVNYISGYAFSDCVALTSIKISGKVTEIGEGAFKNCRKLKKVYFNGTAEEWAKIKIGVFNTYLSDDKVYFYSEEQPADGGNYWHYDGGEITEWRQSCADAEETFRIFNRHTLN